MAFNFDSHNPKGIIIEWDENNDFLYHFLCFYFTLIIKSGHQQFEVFFFSTRCLGDEKEIATR